MSVEDKENIPDHFRSDLDIKVNETRDFQAPFVLPDDWSTGLSTEFKRYYYFKLLNASQALVYRFCLLIKLVLKIFFDLFPLQQKREKVSWIPPVKAWNCSFGLPFGWEIGIDANCVPYFIGHVTETTTYRHPNLDTGDGDVLQQAIQTKRRRIAIRRDSINGFGFVAGSEKPVLIRSVMPGSPSEGLLSANDQIFSINGQIAYNLPQPQVISMIRSCTDVLELDVIASEDIQDVKNQGKLKSALMSRATRERRKSCPVNVRFDDKPEVVDITPYNVLNVNMIKQMLPNVLKVFLENGQTKSFQYTPETTVQDIFDSLVEKLQLKTKNIFCLVLIGPYPNQISFLHSEDRIAQVLSRKHFSRWECRLQVIFAPRDPYDLLQTDSFAFDYLYDQTKNSVINSHFGAELKYDVALRLAALQMNEEISRVTGDEERKLTLKEIQKEHGGLEKFLPRGIMYSTRKKDLKKSLSYHLKLCERLTASGQKHINSLQAKLHYLKIASEAPTFGGKSFSAVVIKDGHTMPSFREKQIDHSTVSISSVQGIGIAVPGTSMAASQLADFIDVTGMVMTTPLVGKDHLKLFIKDSKPLSFLMEPQDAEDMAFLVSGYHRSLAEENTEALRMLNFSQSLPRLSTAENNSEAPAYSSKHAILPSTWSYPENEYNELWNFSSLRDGESKLPDVTIPINFANTLPKIADVEVIEHEVPKAMRRRTASDFGLHTDSDKKRFRISDQFDNIERGGSFPNRNHMRSIKTVSLPNVTNPADLSDSEEITEVDAPPLEKKPEPPLAVSSPFTGKGNSLKRFIVDTEDDDDVDEPMFRGTRLFSGGSSDFARTSSFLDSPGGGVVLSSFLPEAKEEEQKHPAEISSVQDTDVSKFNPEDSDIKNNIDHMEIESPTQDVVYEQDVDVEMITNQEAQKEIAFEEKGDIKLADTKWTTFSDSIKVNRRDEVDTSSNVDTVSSTVVLDSSVAAMANENEDSPRSPDESESAEDNPFEAVDPFEGLGKTRQYSIDMKTFDNSGIKTKTWESDESQSPQHTYREGSSAESRSVASADADHESNENAFEMYLSSSNLRKTGSVSSLSEDDTNMFNEPYGNSLPRGVKGTVLTALYEHEVWTESEAENSPGPISPPRSFSFTENDKKESPIRVNIKDVAQEGHISPVVGKPVSQSLENGRIQSPELFILPPPPLDFSVDRISPTAFIVPPPPDTSGEGDELEYPEDDKRFPNLFAVDDLDLIRKGRTASLPPRSQSLKLEVFRSVEDKSQSPDQRRVFNDDPPYADDPEEEDVMNTESLSSDATNWDVHFVVEKSEEKNADSSLVKLRPGSALLDSNYISASTESLEIEEYILDDANSIDLHFEEQSGDENLDKDMEESSSDPASEIDAEDIKKAQEVTLLESSALHVSGQSQDDSVQTQDLSFEHSIVATPLEHESSTAVSQGKNRSLGSPVYQVKMEAESSKRAFEPTAPVTTNLSTNGNLSEPLQSSLPKPHSAQSAVSTSADSEDDLYRTKTHGPSAMVKGDSKELPPARNRLGSRKNSDLKYAFLFGTDPVNEPESIDRTQSTTVRTNTYQEEAASEVPSKEFNALDHTSGHSGLYNIASDKDSSRVHYELNNNVSSAKLGTDGIYSSIIDSSNKKTDFGLAHQTTTSSTSLTSKDAKPQDRESLYQDSPLTESTSLTTFTAETDARLIPTEIASSSDVPDLDRSIDNTTPPPRKLSALDIIEMDDSEATFFFGPNDESVGEKETIVEEDLGEIIPTKAADYLEVFESLSDVENQKQSHQPDKATMNCKEDNLLGKGGAPSYLSRGDVQAKASLVVSQDGVGENGDAVDEAHINLKYLREHEGSVNVKAETSITQYDISPTEPEQNISNLVLERVYNDSVDKEYNSSIESIDDEVRSDLYKSKNITLDSDNSYADRIPLINQSLSANSTVELIEERSVPKTYQERESPLITNRFATDTVYGSDRGLASKYLPRKESLDKITRLNDAGSNTSNAYGVENRSFRDDTRDTDPAWSYSTLKDGTDSADVASASPDYKHQVVVLSGSAKSSTLPQVKLEKSEEQRPDVDSDESELVERYSTASITDTNINHKLGDAVAFENAIIESSENTGSDSDIPRERFLNSSPLTLEPLKRSLSTGSDGVRAELDTESGEITFLFDRQKISDMDSGPNKESMDDCLDSTVPSSTTNQPKVEGQRLTEDDMASAVVNRKSSTGESIPTTSDMTIKPFGMRPSNIDRYSQRQDHVNVVSPFNRSDVGNSRSPVVETEVKKPSQIHLTSHNFFPSPFYRKTSSSEKPNLDIKSVSPAEYYSPPKYEKQTNEISHSRDGHKPEETDSNQNPEDSRYDEWHRSEASAKRRLSPASLMNTRIGSFRSFFFQGKTEEINVTKHGRSESLPIDGPIPFRTRAAPSRVNFQPKEHLSMAPSVKTSPGDQHYSNPLKLPSVPKEERYHSNDDYMTAAQQPEHRDMGVVNGNTSADMRRYGKDTVTSSNAKSKLDLNSASANDVGNVRNHTSPSVSHFKTTNRHMEASPIEQKETIRHKEVSPIAPMVRKYDNETLPVEAKATEYHNEASHADAKVRKHSPYLIPATPFSHMNGLSPSELESKGHVPRANKAASLPRESRVKVSNSTVVLVSQSASSGNGCSANDGCHVIRGSGSFSSGPRVVSSSFTSGTTHISSFRYEDRNSKIVNLKSACDTARLKAVTLRNHLLDELKETKTDHIKHLDKTSLLDSMRAWARSFSKSTRNIVSCTTDADEAELCEFIHSSLDRLNNLVISTIMFYKSAIISNMPQKNTLQDTVKSVLVVVDEYGSVIECIHLARGKSMNDHSVVNLIDQADQLGFAVTIVIRSIRSASVEIGQHVVN